MGRDGLANAVDARASERDFEEELGREDMVFDVWVRDVDGVGGEESNGVDLKKGCDFRHFEISVESVTQHCVAGIGVGTWLDG